MLKCSGCFQSIGKCFCWGLHPCVIAIVWVLTPLYRGALCLLPFMAVALCYKTFLPSCTGVWGRQQPFVNEKCTSLDSVMGATLMSRETSRTMSSRASSHLFLCLPTVLEVYFPRIPFSHSFPLPSWLHLKTHASIWWTQPLVSLAPTPLDVVPLCSRQPQACGG